MSKERKQRSPLYIPFVKRISLGEKSGGIYREQNTPGTAGESQKEKKKGRERAALSTIIAQAKKTQ